ncbi:MAG: glycosyltransferase family 2 protein [Hyphomonadaceae bacterium]|nr:glycosyltransferase family 2 protein [Rhodocyclaceae bacterium]MBY0447362.1 glycosyltransferase family 2 protein [Hyphomonadaceae bacterium]
MKPTVTIVIVNWNSGDLLLRCVEHCLRQTLPAEAIVVVDNASTDNSLDGVESQQSVSIMRMDRNLGFAAANNRAIEQCGTDWILLLNPDAFAEPGCVEALLAAAGKYPDIGAFGIRQIQHGTVDVLDGIGDSYFISGQIRRDQYQKSCRPQDKIAREIFSPCAAAAMFRKDALHAVGGFDEDFFCYVEDVDLGFRLRLLGHRCWYVPDSVVLHVGSAVTGRHSDFSVYHGHRNLVWAFVKNMPGVLFWLLLPLHVALNLVSVIWFALRGQGAVILRAKRDALLGLPKMWRKRQQLQKTRVASIRDVWRMLDKRLLPIRRKP